MDASWCSAGGAPGVILCFDYEGARFFEVCR